MGMVNLIFKIDMHCHTAKGSLDGMVDAEEIISGLKKRGFSGILITDHNSYKGYIDAKKHETKNFKVLKGIEYDSFDCGHILIILPEGADSLIFTVFGMPLRILSREVHKRGGVLGLAHPYDHGALGAFRRHLNKKREREIMSYIDFVEVFNSSACENGNYKAYKLAEKYKKTMTCGSDCHKKKSIGLANTILELNDLNQNFLIQAIKENKVVGYRGEYLQKHFVRTKHVWFNFATTVYFFLGHAKLKFSRS